MKKWLMALFLAAEAVAYYRILTGGGALLCFGAILGCLGYAALTGRDRLVTAGLLFTTVADLFLVMCDPIQRLWGMVAFLLVQTLYAVRLHRKRKDSALLLTRIVMVAAAELAALLVLGKGADLLALVSMAYYAMLVMNLVHCFYRGRRFRRFSVALVLFLLCDTVIGLQVASEMYLPVSEGSLLMRILYPGFNLAWLFYLPSQVLIALDGN